MFKLILESTKDINEIHINFADGTSIVTGNDKSLEKEEKSFSRKNPDKDYLNTDIEYEEVSQEIIEKPDVSREDRPIKVASELQSLDI